MSIDTSNTFSTRNAGALVAVSPIALSGCGFYVVHRGGHPKTASIKAFIAWTRALA